MNVCKLIVFTRRQVLGKGTDTVANRGTDSINHLNWNERILMLSEPIEPLEAYRSACTFQKIKASGSLACFGQNLEAGADQ